MALKQRDGRYVLELPNTELEVDPRLGGRVTAFTYDGQNVLAGPEVTGSDVNWGATFWPSPQSAWGWPPTAEIDSAPYSVQVLGDELVLTTPEAARSSSVKLSLIKRFRTDASAGAFELEYVLKNEDSVPKRWAPWQISRVGPRGLTFFPTGSAAVRDELSTTLAAGMTWYRHVPGDLPPPPDGKKLCADAGAPWLAHVKDGLLFLKTFPEVAPERAAPLEGEVEIYGARAYVEIEPQGEYTELAPGESLEWTVRWYLRPLPEGVQDEVGDPGLVRLVQSLTG